MCFHYQFTGCLKTPLAFLKLNQSTSIQWFFEYLYDKWFQRLGSLHCVVVPKEIFKWSLLSLLLQRMDLWPDKTCSSQKMIVHRSNPCLQQLQTMIAMLDPDRHCRKVIKYSMYVSSTNVSLWMLLYWVVDLIDIVMCKLINLLESLICYQNCSTSLTVDTSLGEIWRASNYIGKNHAKYGKLRVEAQQ